MVSIARKNLFHDRGRLAITLIGLAASLILILFSTGMCIGTLDTMVVIVDRTDADIWVMQEGNKSMMSPSIIQEGVTEEIKQIEGVKSIHKLVFNDDKLEKDNIQMLSSLVGFDLQSKVGAPWNLASGKIAKLKQKDTVIVDESIKKKVGNISIGGVLSVNGNAQKIAGFSREAIYFINIFVFTSYENAKKLSRLGPGETNFILVKLDKGADAVKMSRKISKIKGVDARPSLKVREATRDFMIYESGMGMGIGVMALVGLFVAAVIIALTTYTATMERIPEFGTLKAMGASKKDIYRIVLEQVFLNVNIGFVIGAIFSFGIANLVIRYTLLPIKITPSVLIFAYFSTLILSVLGSFASIRKVNKIDPAIVFRA
jgi:putative ABC transport system permease protein